MSERLIRRKFDLEKFDSGSKKMTGKLEENRKRNRVTRLQIRNKSSKR